MWSTRFPQSASMHMALSRQKPIYDIRRCRLHGTGTHRFAHPGKSLVQSRYSPRSEVVRLQRENGHFLAHTTPGTKIRARTVFIAGGVGSFQRGKLKLPWYRIAGRQVPGITGSAISAVPGSEAHRSSRRRFRARLGAGIAPQARELTLVHLSDQFRAAQLRLRLFASIVAAGGRGSIEFWQCDFVSMRRVVGSYPLRSSRTTPHGHTLAADIARIFWPFAETWTIAKWGLEMDKKTIKLTPAPSDQHCRNFRHRGYLDYWEKEANSQRIPRGSAGGFCGQGTHRTGKESAPAIHDDEPSDAAAAWRCKKRLSSPAPAVVIYETRPSLSPIAELAAISRTHAGGESARFRDGS